VKFEVPIPPGAEERAHRVAMAAFAERRPAPKRRSYWRPAIAIAVVAAVAGILTSPPGRSVIRSIREAVGVENAKRELFSLPAPGRLLVDSPSGPWVVNADGSRRLLGDYREAAWSPFGRFVAGTRTNELVALDPQGDVHWTLARPGVRSPRWGGLRDDTRVAYLAHDGLHVVAGDGTGDRLLTRGEQGTFAWRPGVLAQLLAASPDGLRLVDTDSGRVLWRTASPPARRVAWSEDGKRLLVLTARDVRLYDERGRLVSRDSRPAVDATFVGAAHRFALLGPDGAVGLLGDAKPIFRAAGLRRLVSSPDGSRLLVTWPAADQWVFVRVAAPHTLSAVAGIARQFGGDGFPNIAGWVK
jgi:hypothetical protein